jgi:hypothetical protein
VCWFLKEQAPLHANAPLAAGPAGRFFDGAFWGAKGVLVSWGQGPPCAAAPERTRNKDQRILIVDKGSTSKFARRRK